MELEQQRQQAALDRDCGLERDLYTISQILNHEESPYPTPITLVPSDDTFKYIGFESPSWLSAPYDEEPSAFGPQSFSSHSGVAMNSLSSFLFSLERELFGPSTSDVTTPPITQEISSHEVSSNEQIGATTFSSEMSIFDQQQRLVRFDDDKLSLSQTGDHPDHEYSDDLQGLFSLPQPDHSSLIMPYPSTSWNLQERLNSLNELLLGGDSSRDSGVVVTPNSSLSTSFSEEALDEECSHPIANSLSLDQTFVGSKRKASELTSNENPIAVVQADSKKNKTVRKVKKRLRQPRYAIQTRSDKDVLEDGYKWRKYGQKTVKDNPHPRSYYRCTYNKCLVKKTVERSCKDSGLVITNYEGVHLHPSPIAIRCSAADASLFLDTILSRSQDVYDQILSTDHSRQLSAPANTNNIGFGLAMQIRGSRHLPQLDKGLLHDMIPSTMPLLT